MEPSKSEIAINWIGHGLLRTFFDPRLEEVIVPNYLRAHQYVVLEWGFDLPRPIPDMKLDPEAISGTLSFGVGLRMFCFVPWSAVYCIVSPVLECAKLYINDAPRANASVKAARRQARQMKSHLRIVKKDTGT
jgi:hypothetical protein